MLGKTGFTTSVFEIPKLLVETDRKLTSGLSDIFFYCMWARYLIDPAIVLFAFCAVMSCCKKFTYGIVCWEPNFHIGDLESFRKGSSLFPNVSEFCPLHFLTVFFVFFFFCHVNSSRLKCQIHCYVRFAVLYCFIFFASSLKIIGMYSSCCESTGLQLICVNRALKQPKYKSV